MLRLMKKNRHCPLCHLEVCCHTGCVNSTSDQGYWLNNVHSFKVHFVCQCNIPLTQKIPDPQLPIRYSMTTSVTLVRNLGVIMDLSLSFLSHVSHIISSSFYQLRRINCSIKVLPIDTAKSLVNSFVISSIDCCNSLLTGLPHYTLDSLQRVINPAARMLCGAGKYSECYQIRALAACGTVALCLMMYKAMHGLALHIYSNSVQVLVLKVKFGRLLTATLQLADETKFGRHAFVIAGQAAWNWLPCCVHNSASVDSFKTALKTFLFTANI